MDAWNPWHGCHKISPGCAHCYVYRRDGSIGKDAALVSKTASFDLPVKRKKDGMYKLPLKSVVYTCMTSDFFLDDADAWRQDAWRFIAARPDCRFVIITKRIHRFSVSLPADWGEGYPHVTIACTCENQDRADYRMPIFLSLPIRHREVICEPLLGAVDLSKYLSSQIERVSVGGESGDDARICRYDWVLSLRDQCAERGVPFHFKQTGALFEKDGRTYAIPRSQQMRQASKARIDIP